MSGRLDKANISREERREPPKRKDADRGTGCLSISEDWWKACGPGLRLALAFLAQGYLQVELALEVRTQGSQSQILLPTDPSYLISPFLSFT